MGKAWEEVAPQIWAFFQNGIQVKMIRVGLQYSVTEQTGLNSTPQVMRTRKVRLLNCACGRNFNMRLHARSLHLKDFKLTADLTSIVV